MLRRWMSGASVEELVSKDTHLKYPRLYRHKLGTVVVPEFLRSKLTAQLRGYPRPALRENAAVLAEVLRKRVRSRPSDAAAGVIKPRVTLRYDKDETATYLAHRVPGIFATAFRVLREAGFKLPSFQPQSILDYGSGPGTAIWAAKVVWPDSLHKFVAIEPSEWMAKASEGLLKDVVAEGAVERRRALVVEAELKYDLVVASYSLGEIHDPVKRGEEVTRLWSVLAPGGLIVLIEPGTPIGFKTILDARSALLKLGGPKKRRGGILEGVEKNARCHVIAPCPHALECPMPPTSWCHFKQRTRKTALQMQTKLNKAVNFNDEKFSYIVLGKGRADDEMTIDETTRHRVTRQPMKKGGHVVLETCSAQGVLEQITVAKSHGKEVYRSARKAFWGDELFIDREKNKDEEDEEQ